MNGESVADIIPGQPDSTGSEILTVYARVSGRYAVYRTVERVSIQFADDPVLGADQRKALVKLNPLRGQINGLIDGWRAAEAPEYGARNMSFWRGTRAAEIKAKAKMFDRRVADALVMGLQGDADHAAALLAEIKEDLLEERTSAARVDYVAIAALAAGFAILLACTLTWSVYANGVYRFSPSGRMLWLGAGAGAVGALFSTGIAMRSRAILTDLQTRENRTDAILRIGTGAMAGVLLVAMLQAKIISFSLGGGGITTGGGNDWLIMAFAGFVAGFSERLVPDLLEKSTAAPPAKDRGNPLAGATPAAPVIGSSTAGETNPLGRQLRADEPSDASAAHASLVAEEDDVDGCLADEEIAEEDATDDSQLPAALGGVEEPVAETRPPAPAVAA